MITKMIVHVLQVHWWRRWQWSRFDDGDQSQSSEILAIQRNYSKPMPLLPTSAIPMLTISLISSILMLLRPNWRMTLSPLRQEVVAIGQLSPTQATLNTLATPRYVADSTWLGEDKVLRLPSTPWLPPGNWLPQSPSLNLTGGRQGIEAILKTLATPGLNFRLKCPSQAVHPQHQHLHQHGHHHQYPPHCPCPSCLHQPHNMQVSDLALK